jgi:hypothetical protein
LNNISSYYSLDLVAIYEETGVRLKYLSLYLPDYNVIEKSFSILKAWMRRNRELISFFEPFFKGYIYLAVQIACNREAIKGFFQSMLVNINKDDINIDYLEL